MSSNGNIPPPINNGIVPGQWVGSTYVPSRPIVGGIAPPALVNGSLIHPLGSNIRRI